MSDVYCLLRLPLPFRVRLNGETWEISHDRAMKSGHHLIKATLWGRADQERKWYTLYAGRESEVYAALECGFPVQSGTPERGLVTAMRRAGVAIVLTEKLPRIPLGL